MKGSSTSYAMVLCLAVTAVLAVPTGARQILQKRVDVTPAEDLKRLSQLADEAHERGDIGREIEYRRRYSEKTWVEMESKPRDRTIHRWNVLDSNDIPLAILLEGVHKWPEAEELFRRNRHELARNPVAGNDIKSDNELHLAHLLAREGKQEEARKICAYWEKRVRHNADYAVYAMKYDVPTPPLYDSPEVEVGAWDLACGRPEQGMNLLREQMAVHPRMLTPYTFLSQYYFAESDFEGGLKTEADGSSALLVGPTVDVQIVLSESRLH